MVLLEFSRVTRPKKGDLRESEDGNVEGTVDESEILNRKKGQKLSAVI